MSTHLRFYNPREAPPEVLEAMLVGREDILNELLSDLARQASSASRQHWLLRGPRGIGKTHLVGIVYHRLRSSPELSQRYLPIWLAETEAYSAYSAAVLLLQIAERLVEELRLAGDPGAEELEKRLRSLEPAGDDPALFEEVCEILKAESARRKKILLVLMENLDALLTSYSGQRGAKEVRRLRALLSEDKELLFLSTTPTRFLALADPKQPLYGHLKERTIRPLQEEEFGHLLKKLENLTGRPELLAESKPDVLIRRRVLHRLTGGNPRAAVMAFSVLTGTPGVQAMVQDLSALLDAQTAYFEARLAQLAPRERTIVAAMALAPENLTATEIAARTRLPLRSLSTQLDRLTEQGYVGFVSGEKGKGTIYELSDGLFRIWYQYRKGRKLLLPIVQFLALWHPAEDLAQSLRRLQETTGKNPSPFEADLIRMTAIQIESALHLATSDEGRKAREDLWAECTRGAAPRSATEPLAVPIESADPQELLQLAERLLNVLSKSPDPKTAGYLLKIAGGLVALKQGHEAAKVFRGLIAVIDDSTEMKKVAGIAWLGLGAALVNLNTPAEAIQPYGRFLELYKSSPGLWDAELFQFVQVELGTILLGMNDFKGAFQRYRKALTWNNPPTEHSPYLTKQAIMGISSSSFHSGQVVRAREVLKEALKRLDRSSSPLFFEVQAEAFVHLSRLQAATGELQNARATCLENLRRFEGSTQKEARLAALRSKLFLGLLEVSLGHAEAGEKAVLDWATALAAEGLWDPRFLAELALLIAFPEKLVRRVLDLFARSEEPNLAQNAALFSHISEALAAIGPAKTRGPAAQRLRRVLARVPSELRPTIEEIVEPILILRRRAAGESAPETRR